MLDNWRYLKQKYNKLEKNKTQKKVVEDKININAFHEAFEGSTDVKYEHLVFESNDLYLIFIDELVDVKLIDDNVLKPITTNFEKESTYKGQNTLMKIENGLLPHILSEVKTDIDSAVNDVLNGKVCLIDSSIENKAITFDVKKVDKRNITEPTNENIIKGSKEAFIENIKSNLGLVRNRIKTSDLKVKLLKVGTDAPTDIAVIYMDSIVDENILNELLRRIEKVKTKKLVAVSDLEEQIIERKYSIFPQLLYTEKTDKFVANIIDGKIGIIIDGVPVTYIVPALFNMFFQAPEDYAANYAISTILRILRYICVAITLIAPGLYISISTFHQEMIPTDLAMSIIKSKQGEPLPVLLEVIFMLLAFEILIEASIRLPKTIGQTISIIGGLIIGEAAVNADFVSPAVVVLIAITGIAGFLMPNQDFGNALRICRFLLVILSGLAGLYGLSLGLIIILYYISTLEPFGVPYLTPFAANEGKNIIKDTITRLPSSNPKRR